MKIQFSRAGYSAVFDMRKQLLWSDDRSLFRKLMTDKTFKGLELEYIGVCGCTFMFRYRKRLMQVMFHVINEKLFLCRVYPQISDVPEAFAEELQEIKETALTLMSLTECFRDQIESGRPVDFDVLADAYAADSENLYLKTAKLLNLVNQEDDKYYIPVFRYLMRSFQNIRYFSGKIGKRVCFLVDIRHKYAKINYSEFEKALFYLSRVLLRISDSQKVFIDIVSCDRYDGNTLTIQGKAHYSSVVPSREDADIQLLKVLFEKFEAAAEFSADEGQFEYTAVMPMHFTDISRFVDYKHDLKLNPDVISSAGVGRRSTKLYYVDDPDSMYLKSPKVEYNCPVVSEAAYTAFSGLVSEHRKNMRKANNE